MEASGAGQETYTDRGGADEPEEAAEEKGVSIGMVFPQWMAAAIDAEAKRIGLTRQGVVKIWCDRVISARGSV